MCYSKIAIKNEPTTTNKRIAPTITQNNAQRPVAVSVIKLISVRTKSKGALAIWPEVAKNVHMPLQSTPPNQIKPPITRRNETMNIVNFVESDIIFYSSVEISLNTIFFHGLLFLTCLYVSKHPIIPDAIPSQTGP
jgi:hypothetical protein